MPVETLIRFPDQTDRLYAEAQEFRRLSPDERLLRMLDLIACGETLMAHSPKRDVAQRLREQSEADWQDAIKQFIARHG